MDLVESEVGTKQSVPEKADMLPMKGVDNCVLWPLDADDSIYSSLFIET